MFSQVNALINLKLLLFVFWSVIECIWLYLSLYLIFMICSHYPIILLFFVIPLKHINIMLLINYLDTFNLYLYPYLVTFVSYKLIYNSFVKYLMKTIISFLIPLSIFNFLLSRSNSYNLQLNIFILGCLNIITVFSSLQILILLFSKGC